MILPLLHLDPPDPAALSARAARPLAAGKTAPDAGILDLNGKPTTLRNAVGGRPTVLVFYRGGWCPYCNAHLKELAKIREELGEKGYQIIAITPDRPEELVKTIAGEKLPYRLFSDPEGESMRRFGVAFRMDDGTYRTYKTKYGLDIEKRNGRTHRLLPVPSVFLIDTKGTIKFAHSNPDYSKRLSGSELLAAVAASK